MLVLKSPAKINLFLRVLRRRLDGYHELASLFQAIDLYDTLTFSLADNDGLTCSDAEIPVDHTNLVSKAIQLFRLKTGLSFHIKVHLEKIIPHQAGLGGGSSNAATTLWALNQLFGYPVSLDRLILWSADIGSDISFFLSEGTAYCTGRGEIIESVPRLIPQHLIILKPHYGISTPAVYKNLKVDSLKSWDPNFALAQTQKGYFFCKNDLEISAFEIIPSLKILKDLLLRNGCEQPTMSGSGSAFFCLGNQNAKCDFILDDNLTMFKTKFINRSSQAWYGE